MMKIKPKDMKNLERMGIKTENIDATRVIIETQNGKIIIESPTVTKTVAMGQEAIIIMGGEKREEKNEESTGKEIKEEDVKFIAEQTGKSEAEAREALEKANGDIAKAIMILTGSQDS
ncbi:nascent polypeptide-associated complex protein [Acidianus brierleyi]|uniref:Nascent polypeptide-associated complex protein n=1 Tax=Acidianus brierleyi TaxID=41673 RepID=A0A2U9IFR3_9CREN|nr:nascent polypeptide-associated complex protein [Acidianus brierleyi]AWR94871.1 nascent polypeptide-associated complex protein [Acidianus brierleyi]